MILFLYGEDTFRSRQKLQKIEEKFKETDKSRVNLVKIDGERSSWKNIEKEISAPSFLHDKKLVIVENFLKKRGQKFEEVGAFLKEERIPAGAVIVFWEEKPPDERTAVFKILNQPKRAERFELLSPSKLNRWVLEEVKKQGANIERSAAAALVELVGPDLWQMSAEIKKLEAYSRGCGEKERMITVRDVNLFVHGKFDENIFNLTDAIGNKNRRLALKLLSEQIEAGINEIYIFSMLVRQFRILLQIKEIVEKDYSFLAPGDPSVRQKIAEEFFLHPYVVAKALYQIKNYNMDELKKIYGKLLAIDMKMKKTNLSPRVLLDLFIAEACLGA